MENTKNNYLFFAELLKFKKKEEILASQFLDYKDLKGLADLDLVGENDNFRKKIKEKKFNQDLIRGLIFSFLILAGFTLLWRVIEIKFLSSPIYAEEKKIIEEVRASSFENVPSASEIINRGYLRSEKNLLDLDNNLLDNESEIDQREIIISQNKRAGDWWQKILGIKVAQAAGKSFETKKISQSYEEFNIKPGRALTFEVELENIGRETWRQKGEGRAVLRVYEPMNRESAFYHKWWKGPYEPAGLLENEVKPGEKGHFRFPLQAPQEEGEYLEKFKVMIGEAFWLEGSLIEIKIFVFEDFSQKYLKQKIEVQGLEVESDLAKKVSNPNIRVGLYSTSREIRIISNTIYEVRDTKNELIFEVAPSQEVKVEFNFETLGYLAKFNNKTNIGFSALRFIPQEGGILEIKNFENRPSWNQAINDNTFRGILEIYYSPKTEKLWVINELLLEDYLKGLAESTNSASQEFQKALAIAARTYTLYHLENPTKHEDNNFIVDALYDQVYRGYNLERRLTNFVEAVEATRGLVVTYEDQVVVTPYFSQSDGHTRAWEEVWGGGAKPWLKSKEDPYNKGLELLGHGVGMSASGAMGLARAGFGYEEILKYYYTGVEIKNY